MRTEAHILAHLPRYAVALQLFLHWHLYCRLLLLLQLILVHRLRLLGLLARLLHPCQEFEQGRVDACSNSHLLCMRGLLGCLLPPQMRKGGLDSSLAGNLHAGSSRVLS